MRLCLFDLDCVDLTIYVSLKKMKYKLFELYYLNYDKNGKSKEMSYANY